MRIVSQKRDASYNFERIEVWTQDNYIYTKALTDSRPIGFYETPERAKEVFNEIHEFFYKPLTASDIERLMSGETENNYDLFYMPEE